MGGERSWTGNVEVRLKFTGRQFLRLRLDNCPADLSVPATAASVAAAAVAAGAEGQGQAGRAAAAAAVVPSASSLAPPAVGRLGAGLKGEEETQASPADVVSGGGGASAPTAVSAAVAVAGSGSGPAVSSSSPLSLSLSSSCSAAVAAPAVGGKRRRVFFSPTPLAGPKPALATGVWASLAAYTAAASTDTVSGEDGDSEEGGGATVERNDTNNDDNDSGGEGGSGEGGGLGAAGIWVNRPLAVLALLRGLLSLPTLAYDDNDTAFWKKGETVAAGCNGSGGGARDGSALVGLLESGWSAETPTEEEHGTAGGGEGYAEGMRRGRFEELAGKMRLLLRADMAFVGEGEGGVRLGRAEFVSLVEDVHRSVERTTRQR